MILYLPFEHTKVDNNHHTNTPLFPVFDEVGAASDETLISHDERKMDSYGPPSRRIGFGVEGENRL